MEAEARLADRLWLRIDRGRRERALRLAYERNVSEAEIIRQALDMFLAQETDGQATRQE